MAKKRGSVEVQFNWIYALVVGALILLAVSGFVLKQSADSRRTLSAQLVRDVNTILTQASVSVGKADSVKIVEPIRLSCDPVTCNRKFGCTSTISMGSSGIGSDTSIQVIFSPDVIQGDKMLTWVLGWNMPYHAANFLYVTSYDVRYIFIGDDSNLVSLFNALPEKDKLNKERFSAVSSITDKNNYKVRLVFWGQNPIMPDSLIGARDKSVSAVAINPDPSDGKIGTVTFYQKKGSRLESLAIKPYFDKETLYGALFAENAALYECNLKKAMLRLSLVSEVYSIKVANLTVIETAQCKAKWEAAPASEVDRSIQGITTNSGDPIPLSTLVAGGIGPFKTTIQPNAKTILDTNNLLKINSCALIY